MSDLRLESDPIRGLYTGPTPWVVRPVPDGSKDESPFSGSKSLVGYKLVLGNDP